MVVDMVVGMLVGMGISDKAIMGWEGKSVPYDEQAAANGRYGSAQQGQYDQSFGGAPTENYQPT